MSTQARDALVSLAKLVETEGRPWAILPEILKGLSQMRGRSLELAEAEEEFRALFEASDIEAARRTKSQLRAKGDVALIPLKGVLTPQVSLLALLFGMGSSLARFRDNIRSAATDDSIGAVVIDVDSPGGLVDQIPETAAEIRAVRENKPVIAVANTLAASAAYWLASQADEVVVTPSGEVGSIGVYTEHRDISQALAAAGIKPTLVSAGKYKVEGNPYEPITDAGIEALQEGVDYIYGLFVSDVAKGRDATTQAVRNGYGEGRVLNAKRAVAEGLADRIDTLDATIARVTGGSSSGSDRRAQDPSSTDTTDDVPSSGDQSSEEMGRVHDALFA